MASVIGKIRNRAVKLTDSRVRLVSEVLTGVRVVKYNGWSLPFLERIQGLRQREMAHISKAGYLRSANSTIKVKNQNLGEELFDCLWTSIWRCPERFVVVWGRMLCQS
jgi:hypothetical protein